MIFSIAMGAEYLSYVKSIALFAPTFYGYIISVLASVAPTALVCVFSAQQDERLQLWMVEYMINIQKKKSSKWKNETTLFIYAVNKFILC